MIHKLFALAAGLVFTSGSVLADCRFHEDRRADVPVDGASRIEVRVGAGSLEIKGIDGLETIRIRGEACHTRRDRVGDIQIATGREGDLIRIGSDMGDQRDRGDWGALGLVIEVPASARLDVMDSSGDVEIRNVAALTIADSSGALWLEDIHGPTDVQDSSGEIRLRGIGGDVLLNDSSGSIDVDGVRGDVRVERDSSGDIEIARVSGSVRVDVDSSGSIHVSEIGGDFSVTVDSSGHIKHRRVAGTVSLPEGRRH